MSTEAPSPSLTVPGPWAVSSLAPVHTAQRPGSACRGCCSPPTAEQNRVKGSFQRQFTHPVPRAVEPGVLVRPLNWGPCSSRSSDPCRFHAARAFPSLDKHLHALPGPMTQDAGSSTVWVRGTLGGWFWLRAVTSQLPGGRLALLTHVRLCLCGEAPRPSCLTACSAGAIGECHRSFRRTRDNRQAFRGAEAKGAGSEQKLSRPSDSGRLHPSLCLHLIERV